MAQQANNQKRPQYSNPIETLQKGGHTPLEKSARGQEQAGHDAQEKQQKGIVNGEFNLYNRVTHTEKYENERKIASLRQQISQLIAEIKSANSAMRSKVDALEAQVINMPEKLGVYHVRFLEMIAETLQSIKKEFGKSNTWMAAMSSKKAKRGSLFASRSKKQGSAYSQSQELSLTRSVN